MKLFYFLLRHSWKILTLAVVAGAVSGASSAGLLALINSALNAEGGLDGGALMWGFAGLCLFVTLAMIGSQTLMVHLGQGAVRRLRIQLSERILATPLRRLEELGPHRLLVALTDDIGSLSGTLTLIPTLTINGAVVAGALVYLAYLSRLLFLFFLAALVVGVLSYYLPMRRGILLFRDAREERDVLFSHFRGVTEGFKSLKLHRGRRRALVDEIHDTARGLESKQISAMSMYITAASWGQFLVFAVIGALLFVPPAFFDIGREALTGYTLVLLYMMTPLQVILNSLPQIGRANVTVQKLRRLGLSMESEETADETPAALPAAAPAGTPLIELRGVRFAYRGEGDERGFSIGPIDLAVEEGELLFLIGGNGSGKTTLGKVLLGLYPLDDGEIRWRGEPLAAGDLESYRQRFSAVFADFFLFERLLGLELPDLDDRATEMIERLHLDGKVEVRDGAFTTTDLSQGQRKRLALLTACLEDRDVLLFDEWAADQDPEFKGIFYGTLLPRLKAEGKTVVVISHDDAYYDVADRLVKLDFGRIVLDRRPADDAPATGYRVAR